MDGLRADDPAQLGVFRLLGRLGAGWTGQVYLGQAPDGRLAAVKAVYDRFADEVGFRERFAREIDTARRVCAPWTVAIIDAGPNAPRPWLATEYVPGPSLEEWVSHGGPLPEPSVGVLAARLADTLAARHSVGVVHRDLKPSNVLLACDGPRLVDFGIVRAAVSAKPTETGVVLGTPAFMSPEQATGETGGPASDVFSLASVLVFAATGNGPFGMTGNPAAMLLRISEQEPELAEVPGWLREQLAPCLAKEPSARPTSRELATQFARWTEVLNSWPPPAPPADSSPQQPQASPLPTLSAGSLPRPFPGPSAPVAQSAVTPTASRRRWMAVTGVALALVLAVGLAIWLPRASEGRQLGTIQIGPEPSDSAESIVMSRDGAKAYLTSHDTVFVLDTASNTITTRINNPGSIAHTAISADGQRLAIVGLSGFLTMIDTSTDRSIGTAHPLVGGTGLSAPFNSNEQDAKTYPGQLALSPDGRIAYVVNEASGAVAVVDTGSGHVIGAVSVGTEPDAISITPDGRRLLVGAIGGVAVIDTTSNTPLRTIALDPRHANIRAVTGAKQIAVAPDGARAYVRGWGSDISILDLNATTKLGTITTVSSIEDMTVSPSGRYLYTTVLSEKTKLALVIDTANTNAVDQIPLDHSAEGVGFSPKRGRLYVTASVLEQPANTVMVVDPGGRN